MEFGEDKLSSTDNSQLTRQIEALLMVVPEPLSTLRGSEVLGVSSAEFESAIAELQEFYESTERGYFIQRVAGGYRFASRPDMSDLIERFAKSQTAPRLSAAVLETLAIVAYRQPVTRAQISAIRGVNSDYVIKVLLARGFIEWHSRDGNQGGPRYFSTTPTFLEKLGLFSLSELPEIEGFMPGADIAESLEASLFDGD